MAMPRIGVPVDVSKWQLLTVSEAQPQLQYDKNKPPQEREPKTDRNGEILWQVDLVALGEGDAEVIRVSVPGDPKLKQGEIVRAEGLTAHAWEMEDRYGVSFRASALRPVQARAQGEKAVA